jgi:hypothetical protein
MLDRDWHFYEISFYVFPCTYTQDFFFFTKKVIQKLQSNIFSELVFLWALVYGYLMIMMMVLFLENNCIVNRLEKLYQTT